VGSFLRLLGDVVGYGPDPNEVTGAPARSSAQQTNSWGKRTKPSTARLDANGRFLIRWRKSAGELDAARNSLRGALRVAVSNAALGPHRRRMASCSFTAPSGRKTEIRLSLRQGPRKPLGFHAEVTFFGGTTGTQKGPVFVSKGLAARGHPDRPSPGEPLWLACESSSRAAFLESRFDRAKPRDGRPARRFGYRRFGTPGSSSFGAHGLTMFRFVQQRHCAPARLPDR